jgi:hypothetical protein
MRKSEKDTEERISIVLNRRKEGIPRWQLEGGSRKCAS